MRRVFVTVHLLLLAAAPAFAGFNLTGNPVADGWTYGGQSLANGNYVRGTANYSYNMYYTEYDIPSVGSPLTTAGPNNSMVQLWNPGQRVVGLGGVFTPGQFNAASLGWPSITGAETFALANTRIVAKFGVNEVDNIYSASSTAPNAGNGNGSHSTIQGGLGSVIVSIGSGRLSPANQANAGLLITPTTDTTLGLTDLVAQQPPPQTPPGLFNGLPLQVGNNFPSSAFIYNVDGNGFLSSWQILLNTTLAGFYPGTFPIMPTGGSGWIMTVQTGSSGTFTDGILFTQEFVPAPAPPALLLALAGIPALIAIRRKRS